MIRKKAIVSTHPNRLAPRLTGKTRVSIRRQRDTRSSRFLPVVPSSRGHLRLHLLKDTKETTKKSTPVARRFEIFNSSKKQSIQSAR